MDAQAARGGGRFWSLGWVIGIRLVLCLVIAGFLLQHIYFGESWRIYRPSEAIAFLGMVFLLNLAIVAAAATDSRRDFMVALTFVLDLAVLTWIILVSGGYGSVFTTYYLPYLAMASVCLPRRYTAVFPSIATLGTAYVGLAHLLFSVGEEVLLLRLYPEGITLVLRSLPSQAVVATMLVLAVIFFVSSYLSGVVGNRYFALRQRMEEAERNVERFSAISTMAAGLAHEIRNPLAALRSAIQEIGESFTEGDQNRILAHIVMAESDRLDRVIGRFLDFSREGELHLARLRLKPLLEDVRALVLHGKYAEDFRIDLEVRDNPEIICDADRIKEVCLNLALNAVQAMPGPGGRLTIKTMAAARGAVPGLSILFMDNGPGIGEDVLVHLFEPFFTSKANGTGMGLPLSRKQVNMHGGDIEAGNNPGGGAWFRVWLPLEQG